MHKVLFINGQSPQVADTLAGLMPEGFSLQTVLAKAPEAELVSAVADADFLVLHPATVGASVLRAASRLRLVQLLTAGYDKFDLGLADSLGIPVATNGGANAWAVAEHTVAMLLCIYKRLLECDRSVREGTWRKPITGFNTYEVAGKTLGVIGAGNIGRKVARRFHAFEAKIVYCDAVEVAEIERDLGASRSSLTDLLRQSDIVTLHMPLTAATRGLLGRPELASMKPTAVLLNTSRAELVDDAALVEALTQGRIMAAGVDVFSREPVGADHPLLGAPNVLLSPHVAGHALEGWERRARFAWSNMRNVADGEPAASLAVSDAN